MKTERRRRWLTKLFLRFLITMVAMSATETSRLFPYNAAQRIGNDNKDPGYLTHEPTKNILKSEPELRGEDDSSTSGEEQPLHLTRRASTNHNNQERPHDLLLQLSADYTRNQRPASKKTLPDVVKHHRAIFRVKHTGDDGQHLSTSNDNDRPCSLSSDVPPKPHNVGLPSRSRPGFNPTGW